MLHWGVVGAALAATVATTLACSAMCAVMLARDMLRLSDLKVPPRWEAVRPMLIAAVPLTLRNAILIGEGISGWLGLSVASRVLGQG